MPLVAVVVVGTKAARSNSVGLSRGCTSATVNRPTTLPSVAPGHARCCEELGGASQVTRAGRPSGVVGCTEGPIWRSSGLGILRLVSAFS